MMERKRNRRAGLLAATSLLLGIAASGAAHAIPLELEVLKSDDGARDVYSLVHYDKKIGHRCKWRDWWGNCRAYRSVYEQRRIGIVAGQTLLVDYDETNRALSLRDGPQRLDLVDHDGSSIEGGLLISSFDFDLNDNGHWWWDHNDFERGRIDFTLTAADFQPDYTGYFQFNDKKPSRNGVFNSANLDVLDFSLFAWGGNKAHNPHGIKNIGIDIGVGGDAAAVPNPGTLALLGIGFAGLAHARRRRRV